MAFKLPPVTVLPGGRKVRDTSALTVDALAAEKAQDYVGEDELEQPAKKTAKKAEDESLG